MRLAPLSLCWSLYADDNGDKLVNGDKKEYVWDGAYDPGGYYYNETRWVLRYWENGNLDILCDKRLEPGSGFVDTGFVGGSYLCQE